MQGKEASEQETKAKCNVGIDVSKDWLDAHVLPAGAAMRVPNTSEGIRRLKRWLIRFDLGTGIGRGYRQVASPAATKP